MADYENTVLMSEIEGRRGQGAVTGLNGLLLGVARERGIKALCLMGGNTVLPTGFSLAISEGYDIGAGSLVCSPLADVR